MLNALTAMIQAAVAPIARHGVFTMKKSITRSRAGRFCVAETIEGAAHLRRSVREQQARAHELATLLGCMQVAAEDSTTDPQLLALAARMAAGITEALDRANVVQVTEGERSISA